MTTDEAIKILAEREGWHWDEGMWAKNHPEKDGWTSTSYRSSDDLAYAKSLDAIQRVISKLTAEEKEYLCGLVDRNSPVCRLAHNDRLAAIRTALLSPAAQLCLYVAEAIEACKEKGKQ